MSTQTTPANTTEFNESETRDSVVIVPQVVSTNDITLPTRPTTYDPTNTSEVNSALNIASPLSQTKSPLDKLDQPNQQSAPVHKTTVQAYNKLSQKEKDKLSGNVNEFDTYNPSGEVPALLIPIYKNLTPEQKAQLHPETRTNLRILAYPSNQEIARRADERVSQRAAGGEASSGGQALEASPEISQPQLPSESPKVKTPTVPAVKPDTSRLESLAKSYNDSVYSQFRGTDSKAPMTEIYKSLKNATDPEIVKIRELLYGKTDGGQDGDIGLYDVFRSGKSSSETIMKRLDKVPGSTTEEKLKYLEDAAEQVKQYKADFGKPKVAKSPPTPTPTPAEPQPVGEQKPDSMVNSKSAVVGEPEIKNELSANRDTDDANKMFVNTGELLSDSSGEKVNVQRSSGRSVQTSGDLGWDEYLRNQEVRKGYPK